MKKLLTILVLLLCVFVGAKAKASNVSFNITANSGGLLGGPGSFAPSSITVNKGDNVTINFSVPSDDPNFGGMRIQGDGGQFNVTVARGATQSVSFVADTNFTFTGYLAPTNMVKAHGTVNVNTSNPLPPSTPSNVNAIGISTSQIKVTWASATGATGYRVLRNGAQIADTKSLELTDNGLQPNTTYSYRIVAYNNNGISSPSATVSAKTKAPANSANTPNNSTTSNAQNTQSNPLYVDADSFLAKVDDVLYDLNSLPNIYSDQQVELSGTTVAAAAIQVRSEGLVLGNSTAGSDGNWNVKLDLSKLSSGKHTTIISMSANGQESTKEFTLGIADKPTKSIATPNTKSAKENIWPLIAAISGGLILLAGAILPVYVSDPEWRAKTKGRLRKIKTSTLSVFSGATSLVKKQEKEPYINLEEHIPSPDQIHPTDHEVVLFQPDPAAIKALKSKPTKAKAEPKNKTTKKPSKTIEPRRDSIIE